MEKQDYKNHVRYYIPHHFILYPFLLASTVASTVCIFKYPKDILVWIAITIIFILIGLFSFMVRQHYALVNQNRIVRLELRLRYYQLTHKRLEEIESKLTFKQLAALRFASDEELPSLIEKSLAENLSPGKIKRSIKNWIPDEMRV
ncbi:MAG: hypothetical protein JWN78_511 [Bacteroidota bacterium]|nr:hypothetical protein [Bacteroidota bacterium]